MALISKTRWQSIEKLLDEILDLPEQQRIEFLDKSCKADPELKREILDLLEAEKRSPTILDKPARDLYQALITSLGSNQLIEQSPGYAGTTIGVFKLVREIGRGGMGIVYLAERNAGDFDQTVAIKILSNSSQRSELLERFKREQQLLASLDHPNIAKLYDGGVTENGQAYLIMEYIDGKSIDQFIEQNKLDIEQRLELIQQVARAVGFAHKHLIIHRDLKPSNILVKADGTVKLLDFSIAKLVDQEEHLELTQVGSTPMTPGYAAPEQLQNKPVSVTTDIYQLGLVAYFILSGVPAHDKANVSLASLVQQVCNELPPPPSRAILAGEEKTNSKNASKLSGDLDAIILKMLQVEPEQRYPSMEALLGDIEAWFERKPISVRQHSWIYRTTRILQRHWKAATLAAVFLLMLISYAITATWQARKIEKALLKSQIEQDKAEQVSTFLVNIFNAADPNISGFESVTAKQLLETGEQRILEELQQVPGVRNHMLNVLAQIWQRQGNYAHAAKILQTASDAALASQQIETTEYAKTLSLKGINHLYTGENDTALEFTARGVELYEQLIFENQAAANDEYAYLLLLKTQVMNAFGNYDETRPLVTQLIKILEASSDTNNEYLSYAYSELAFIQHMSGEFSEARTNMEKAAELQKRVTGENHTYYTTLVTNLAILYRDAEDYDKAEQLAREALRIHENIFGSDHPFSLHSERATAVILHRKGKLKEAEQRLRKIAEFESTLDQTSSYQSLSTQLRLGAVLQDQGKYSEAENLYEKVISVTSVQTNNELMGRALIQLATTEYQQEDYQQARERFERALTLFGDKNILATSAEAGLALTLIHERKIPEAVQYARQALDKRKQSFGSDHSWVIEAEIIYALGLHHSGKTQEAKALLETSLKKAGQHPGFQFGDRQKLFEKAIYLSNQ